MSTSGHPPPLRVILVEDSADDAELILRALRPLRRSIESRRVEDAEGLRRMLREFPPDLILSDFSMPRFDGIDALGIASELAPGVPFLFVSGTIGEERAIEALHRGAADYVLKDNLARLPSAASRVLESMAEQARRRETERALRASEERFRSVSETTEEWIWECDTETAVTYSNGAIEQLLGIPVHEALGQRVTEWLCPEDRALVEARLPEIAAEGKGWRRWVLRFRHADGSQRWMESNAAPVLDEQGRLVGYRGADRDITDRVEREAKLEFLAYHHPVTGLPNRVALGELLAERAGRADQLVAAMLPSRYYDFVSSRGREFAEELLCAIANRLVDLLPADALVAQLGDQSFLFAIDRAEAVEAATAGAVRDAGAPGDASGLEEAVDYIRRIEQVLAEHPYEVAGEQVHVAARIGVAVSPEHGTDALSLERHAEAALSEAIRRREPIALYHRSQRERIEQAIALERDLRGALQRGEFELFYQPKYRVHGQQLCGAEALLRWRHPRRGLVAPGEFIPVVEQTGMMVQIGDWVRREASAQAARWRERGMPGLCIAVNVSAMELRQPGFVESCQQLLQAHPNDPLIEIELTESLLMEDLQHSIRVLQALRDSGGRIAIDDFGTGYSSLNYLTRLPVDAIKVDRSFIAQLAQSADAVSMVSNVIQLAHSLGLEVVAEGVEDEEQAKLLRLLRCDTMQGFLLGRPLPTAEFERLLFD